MCACALDHRPNQPGLEDDRHGGDAALLLQDPHGELGRVRHEDGGEALLAVEALEELKSSAAPVRRRRSSASGTLLWPAPARSSIMTRRVVTVRCWRRRSPPRAS